MMLHLDHYVALLSTELSILICLMIVCRLPAYSPLVNVYLEGGAAPER